MSVPSYSREEKGSSSGGYSTVKSVALAKTTGRVSEMTARQASERKDVLHIGNLRWCILYSPQFDSQQYLTLCFFRLGVCKVPLHPLPKLFLNSKRTLKSGPRGALYRKKHICQKNFRGFTSSCLIWANWSSEKRAKLVLFLDFFNRD